jgi:hypothetical protein
MWCLAVGGDRGKAIVFYSDPFQHEVDPSIEAAFGDYVKAHYNQNDVQPACHFGLKSKSDASSDRDRDATMRRSESAKVVFTSWTY